MSEFVSKVANRSLPFKLRPMGFRLLLAGNCRPVARATVYVLSSPPGGLNLLRGDIVVPGQFSTESPQLV